MSKTSIVLCIVLSIVTVFVADMIINQKPGAPTGETVVMRNVQVLRTIDSYTYLMKAEQGYIFHARFCENYEPQFDGGMTLDLLQYEDRGDCWDIRNTHPAYLIRRKPNGQPEISRPETETQAKPN